MEQQKFKITFQGEEYDAYYITEREDAVRALAKLEEQDCLFGIDTETCAKPAYKNVAQAALSPHLAEIRLVQVFNGKSSVVFDCKTIADNSIFRQFLSRARFIAHNAVFEIMFFSEDFGVKDMNIGCSMILTKILFHATYPTDEGLSASLKNMIESVFKGEEVGKENQASDWGVDDLIFEQIQYAALDAVYTYKLAEKLAPGLVKFKLEKTYALLKKAQHAIAKLQIDGIKLDVDKHLKAINIWRDKLYTARKEVMEITGLEKITGHTVAEYLLQNLPKETLNIWPVTETGKLSTDSNTFADFSYLPIVAPFSSFQKKEKLCSSFGMNLIRTVNPATGRVHSSYNLTGARTGRLSCSRPNSQQFPHSPDKEKYPDEPDIRENFIAEPGFKFVVADLSQIEIRISAEVSGDKMMTKAYREGLDIHRLTAANILHKPMQDVTSSERKASKALSLGLLYGLSWKKFAHYAKKSYGVAMSMDEAERSVRAWHDLYSGYTDYQQRTVAEARKTLMVRTQIGKLRRLSPDNFYGAGMNHKTQGSAAEIILYSLIRVYDRIKSTATKIVACVHDEIVLEVPEDLVGWATNILKEEMTNAYLDVFPNGLVRDLVSVGSGNNWAEAK